MTNFDISKYDVKRICSSTTLIAGDLAKRSPKDSPAVAISDDGQEHASLPPQFQLAITSGSTNEYAGMACNSMDQQHYEPNSSNQMANDSVQLTSMPSDINLSGPESPKNSGAHHSDRGVQKAATLYDCSGAGGGFGGSPKSIFFPSIAPKYKEVKGNGDENESGEGGNWPPVARSMPSTVHQLPMFALWNE